MWTKKAKTQDQSAALTYPSESRSMVTILAGLAEIRARTNSCPYKRRQSQSKGEGCKIRPPRCTNI
jgi:hypothetical protein